jgi:hypothetical protein
VITPGHKPSWPLSLCVHAIRYTMRVILVDGIVLPIRGRNN